MNRRTIVRRLAGATVATTVTGTATGAAADNDSTADNDATTDRATTAGVTDCCFGECTCRDCTICDDR